MVVVVVVEVVIVDGGVLHLLFKVEQLISSVMNDVILVFSLILVFVVHFDRK